MKRAEVWWVDFDPSLGSEIKKRRPAIIVSNDSANRMLARVTVVPLTSNVDRIYPSEAVVTINDVRSKALADQLTTVDKTRLSQKIASLSKESMLAVEVAITMHLGLPK